MTRFQRNLQNFAENIREFAANFQKICPKKPGTLNRYGGSRRSDELQARERVAAREARTAAAGGEQLAAQHGSQRTRVTTADRPTEQEPVKACRKWGWSSW